MEVGEHIHWYFSSKCNLDCSYCFKPDIFHDVDVERLEYLAQILVKNGVKRVTFSGGEPTLEKDLVMVLRILKDNGVYTSLHTNGVLLDDKKIRQFSEVVDDIAIPLDSMNENVQEELRGQDFIPTFNRLPNIVEVILERGVNLGYHTVFTSINRGDIPKIYDFIKQKNFSYWRIYEFNYDLAFARLFAMRESDEGGEKRLVERVKKISLLQGSGSPDRGYSDCLFAYFLLMEEQMRQNKDERVKFVGIKDTLLPYAFLENSGDVSFYSWFSGRERRVIGNIIREGFPFVKEKLEEINRKVWEFDDKSEDEFVNATMDIPIWARLDNGNYLDEEIEAIDEKFLGDVERLARLYMERGKT